MHEATVGLSFDGQRIFIYKSDNQNSGDLYISQLEEKVGATQSH